MHFLDLQFHPEIYQHLSLTVWALILLALIFDFLNGLHDAANSVATIVSTRVLSPQAAILWAAFFNFIAFIVFPTKVAATIQKDIVSQDVITNEVIAATLLAACGWNILTWYLGLPTSSSHALIGGMIGAALASTGDPDKLVWSGLGWVVLFIVLAPTIGMVLGCVIAVGVTWLFRNTGPRLPLRRAACRTAPVFRDASASFCLAGVGHAWVSGARPRRRRWLAQATSRPVLTPEDCLVQSRADTRSRKQRCSRKAGINRFRW